MNTEIKHKYSDIARLTEPVVDKPFPKVVFMEHVQKGLVECFSRSEEFFKVNCSYANVLELYLDKFNISEINPDEQFIEDMRLVLLNEELVNKRGKPYRLITKKKISRFTRQVINKYFFEKGLVKRQLLLEVAKQKYERFLRLTPNTQKAIQWFEENGKVVKALPVYIERDNDDSNDIGKPMFKRIMKVEDRKLLAMPNATKIQQAMLFLNVIGKDGFEQVVESDVQKLEDYCDQRRLKKKQDYLADVATFFANIHDAGFIDKNSFSHVSLKKDAYSSVKNEFFSSDSIEKIKDLSTINFSNKLEVRDRLFALLGYDLAMRLNELLSLKVSDFKKDSDGELYVRIRPEIQKGTKNENIMYFFFDETKELLEKYLKETRKEFNPQSDYLILAQYGTQLNDNRCRKAFQELCKELGMTTFYGKKPSPHCLRHSFATLNIEPLGLSLPLSGIMDRLRHTRSEIAERHYIHDNPYLKKLKHTVYKKRIKKETSSDLLNRLPLADLEHWLSDKIGIDSSIIELIRRKHKIAFLKSKPIIDKKTDDNIIHISEEEALNRLKEFDISIRSLRNYAEENSSLINDKQESLKYGKNFRYKEELIEDLVENWVLALSVRKRLKLPARSFSRLIKNEKWRIRKIGKNVYIHRQDY